MDKVLKLIDDVTLLLQNTGILTGILLIILESIIPALPLSVFVALNVNAFGLVIGIIMSWLATTIGCYISYVIFKLISNKWLYKLFGEKKIKKVINSIKNINFSSLVVILALPFTPAFLINIAAGLVEMNKKKFIIAVLIGKLFMISFWACIGKSLLESVTDINTIIAIIVAVIIAYLLSKLISKKAHIE